jgi:hypothetical protein
MKDRRKTGGKNNGISETNKEKLGETEERQMETK